MSIKISSRFLACRFAKTTSLRRVLFIAFQHYAFQTLLQHFFLQFICTERQVLFEMNMIWVNLERQTRLCFQ